MAKRIVNIDVDPAPKPPENESNLGMFVLTIVNVCAALFLLYNSVAPAIWGEVIAPFELEFKRNNLLAVGQRSTEFVENEKKVEDAKARYDRYNYYRWLHWLVAAACIAPVIGLMRISFGTYLGDFSLKITTVWLALTFVLTGINYWPLGWGGPAAFAVMGTVALEAGLLHIPFVQRQLSGTPEETAVDAEQSGAAKKKKKKKKESATDGADGADESDAEVEPGNVEAKTANPAEEDYSY